MGVAMPHSEELTGRTSEPKRVLVTGATGKQGGALAHILVRRGHHVRALTRKPEGAPAGGLRGAGIEVVAGDLGDTASLEKAAKGMDVMFLVGTPYERGPAEETRLAISGVDAARLAKVLYLVYSSVSDADRKTGIPHFDSKAVVEEHLRRSGLEYSIVAPVFFMENLLAPWITAAFSKGVFAMGMAPDRKLQIISVPEIAEFTTLVVERPGSFHGKRTNIASDEATPQEMARLISAAANVPLSYVPIPIDQVRQQNADIAAMYDWFNRVGYSAEIPRLKKEYPEVHWRTLSDWLRAQDWAKVLSPAGSP